jgi:hypothetical protein
MLASMGCPGSAIPTPANPRVPALPSPRERLGVYCGRKFPQKTPASCNSARRWGEFSGPAGHRKWEAGARRRDAAATAPARWPAPFPRAAGRPAGPGRGGAAAGGGGAAGGAEWCDDLLPYCAGPANPAGFAAHGLAVDCHALLPFCTGRAPAPAA